MSDLADFLLARVAEDEALVTNGARADWRFRLAECEAKRRIITQRTEFAVPANNEGAAIEHDHVLRLLALPYSDHADHDADWRL